MHHLSQHLHPPRCRGRGRTTPMYYAYPSILSIHPSPPSPPCPPNIKSLPPLRWRSHSCDAKSAEVRATRRARTRTGTDTARRASAATGAPTPPLHPFPPPLPMTQHCTFIYICARAHTRSSNLLLGSFTTKPPFSSAYACFDKKGAPPFYRMCCRLRPASIWLPSPSHTH